MNKTHTIIWDWNGTLLDDTELCISSMNSMLEKRNLAQLDMEKYKQVFTFPVKDYYQAIGFDFTKESWDIAAHEFIYLYLKSLPSCGLAKGALETIRYFAGRGFRQAIISAMQHDALLQSVEALGIRSFLDYIGGTGDHFGAGKIENARSFFHDFNLNPAEVTLIGDTLHDAEVASELGCNCILVAAGHQSKERLISTGKPVINDLWETRKMFEK